MLKRSVKHPPVSYLIWRKRTGFGSDKLTNNSYNGRITYFGGKVNIYVVIYRSKDKNTTQGNLAELVGSPVAPVWCK